MIFKELYLKIKIKGISKSLLFFVFYENFGLIIKSCLCFQGLGRNHI